MKKNRTIIIATLLLSPLLLMGVSLSKPIIKTTHNANGTTITMTLPNNYKGFVQTYYDGTNWQTYATDSPLTKADQAQIQADLIKQQQYWNDFWQAQEKMFQQEQQLFNNLWSNFNF